MAKPLSPARRSELRGEAHKLKPVVLIGDKGLTEEVIAEIDRSLRAHELVKVRAAGGEREQRDIWLESICERLEAHPVQQIGKVFVIYRERLEDEAGPGPSPADAHAPGDDRRRGPLHRMHRPARLRARGAGAGDLGGCGSWCKAQGQQARRNGDGES
jgi:putative YhbY family RNA-binding protein